MLLRRLIALFAALLLTAAATAATVSERSPFAQGHWYDQSKPGSGFELFNVGSQAMVIWYTYESDGTPVWYTAQGEMASMGKDGFPLLKHRWVNGRRGDATQVGTLKVVVNHAESVAMQWQVGGASGTSNITPFITSGVINEVDHTGSWFAPENSGWGFTLTHQGDVLGGVLYYYDTAGMPAWLAGFGRDRASVELHRFTGACLTCAYRPSQSVSAGRLGFEFAREWEMTVRSSLTTPMAAGLAIDGARMMQLSRPASSRMADRQLAQFDTAASLKAFLDTGMLNMPPMYSGVDFSPLPPAGVATFSTTNLVESGVDEAGLMKTDGRFVYTYAHDGYTRKPIIRIAEIGSEGASITVRGNVPLSPPATGSLYSMYNAGLYLTEGKLVSIAGSQVMAMGSGSSPWFYPSAWINGVTRVEIFSTATPGSPTSVWRAEIDGALVASRRIGDRLYLVTRFAPNLAGFMYGRTDPASRAANRALLENTSLAALLPKARTDGGDPQGLLGFESVSVPPLGSRAPMANITVITAIDLASPRVAEARGVVGTAEHIYVSPSNLYLATIRSETRSPITTALLPEPASQVTDIHQIALEANGMRTVGSATVEGALGADADAIPFRFSEHAGKLRMVSSSSTWWGGSRNRVSILEPSTVLPGLLRTVAVLPNTQRPEPLGKPGEFLWGTRFVGDRLYAVTFRVTDPLYVVDLANPADPKITGELVVPGFSEYLHPLDGGLLLGFGRDADINGFMQGLQVSLYDVSDAGRPRELQKLSLGKRGSTSAVLSHHHALSVLRQADGALSLAIPARIHDGAPQDSSPAPMYPWEYSGLLRFELRGTTPADASLRQKSSLVTHSRSSMGSQSFPDPGINDGRSIILRNGTVYIGYGQFWRQDVEGPVAGPF